MARADQLVDDDLGQELAGLDHLELTLPSRPSLAHRLWTALWPKATAMVIALGVWQIVVWSGWRPSYVLPGPAKVLSALGDDRHVVGSGALTTLRHVVTFYLVALVIGTVVAVLITRWHTLRAAVSPLLTGLQTMPSVARVPFAILAFGLSTDAIAFVTILGSAPAIAIGAISGIVPCLPPSCAPATSSARAASAAIGMWCCRPPSPATCPA